MCQKPISELPRRVLEDMVVRKFSEATIRNYIRHIADLAKFMERSPDTATAEDVRRFQVHMTQNGEAFASGVAGGIVDGTVSKGGAPGIDGVTAAEYAQNLEANLWDLVERIKSQPLSSTAGAAGVHPQGRWSWISSAPRPRGRHGAGGHLRAGQRTVISRPSRGFSAYCLCFKNDVATIPARLASGCPAREGIEPPGPR